MIQTIFKYEKRSLRIVNIQTQRNAKKKVEEESEAQNLSQENKLKFSKPNQFYFLIN